MFWKGILDMNTFAINGKLYKAAPLTFNTVCDLDEMGISIEDMQRKPLSTIRGYFTVCIGGNKELAGAEIEAHILNGGKFDGIVEAMTKEIAASDFFQKMMNKETETETETEEIPETEETPAE